MKPRVSVIITTCGRPHLVGRAVRSALGQALRDIEVVVVVDGPDHAVAEALDGIRDPRVRVHTRARQGGQAAAINTGAALATGEWAALLDDDDMWLPGKLELQLRAAESSRCPNPIIGCRFIARAETGDTIWPSRSPAPGEPVSEYLFCRRRFAFGEGALPTSMLFARTELLKNLPMAEDLPRHCDLDWIVKAGALHGAAIELPPGTAPMALWEMQSGRDRLSNQHDWRYSYNWIKRVRNQVTSRAYAGFLLTWASFSARLQKDAAAFGFLLRESLRHGRPSPLEVMVHFGIWGLPLGLRLRLSRITAGEWARRNAPGNDFA